MALRSFTRVALIVALVAGCTARTTSPDTPEVPAAGAPPPVAPAPGRPAEPAGLAELAGGNTARDLPGPDRRCRTDSDCAVKDVGNCCGYYPMCVNKDAGTDPAGVRARCEREGLSSVCGFPEIRGCRCVEGLCESSTGGAVEQ